VKGGGLQKKIERGTLKVQVGGERGTQGKKAIKTQKLDLLPTRKRKRLSKPQEHPEGKEKGKKRHHDWGFKRAGPEQPERRARWGLKELKRAQRRGTPSRSNKGKKGLKTD